MLEYQTYISSKKARKSKVTVEGKDGMEVCIFTASFIPLTKCQPFLIMSLQFVDVVAGHGLHLKDIKCESYPGVIVDITVHCFVEFGQF